MLNSYTFPSPSYLIPRRTQLPGNPPLPQPVDHEHPLHRCGTWSGKGCYLRPQLPGATAVTGTPPGSPPSDNSPSCLYASFQAGSICISVSSPVLKCTGVSERSQSCPNSWGYWGHPKNGSCNHPTNPLYSFQQLLHKQFSTGDFEALIFLFSPKCHERELNKLLVAIYLHWLLLRKIHTHIKITMMWILLGKIFLSPQTLSYEHQGIWFYQNLAQHFIQ